MADYSYEISCLIFFRKLGKMSQNSLSAAVMIGTLRVKHIYIKWDQLSGAAIKLVHPAFSNSNGTLFIKWTF